MRAQPLSLIGGAYADDTLAWTAQDTVNWIPAQAEQEGTRTPTMLKTPPGLKPFVQAGTGVVRGTYNCEGRLFAVIGTTLYRISNTGVAISLGTIPGVGRVVMAHNQITGGNQLLVVNGSSGYVWDTVTEVFQRITDPGYPGAINAVFIDGYLIQIEPARRFAFHSDLADAMEYNTLDRFTSEVSPDLLVSMAVSNNELLLFSETTTEFFENTGATQQPFRSKRITLQRGCAGRYTVAQMDNTVLWLGNDGKFYILEGYTPRRISTRAIEQGIRGLNWSQAFATVWEDSGHTVCYWTFPDGRTWGWDASTGQWHRRESYGLTRWRTNTMTFWNQQWIAGDFQAGRLWQLDWDYLLEGDTEIISERISQVLHDNQSRMLVPRVELLFGMGQPETVPTTFPVQPTGPMLTGNAPDGVEGVLYTPFQYTITPGSTAVMSVKVVIGSLPLGLSLSNSGLLTGTPTKDGAYAFTVRAIDANGMFADVADAISVTDPPP